MFPGGLSKAAQRALMAEIEEAEIEEPEPEAGPSVHWHHDHAMSNGEGPRFCPVCTFLNDGESDSLQCGMCHNSLCEDLWANATSADLQRSSDRGGDERSWSLSDYIPGKACHIVKDRSILFNLQHGQQHFCSTVSRASNIRVNIMCSRLLFLFHQLRSCPSNTLPRNTVRAIYNYSHCLLPSCTTDRTCALYNSSELHCLCS